MFQSPHGDSLFSDEIRYCWSGLAFESFNPLTGIRCFLTDDATDRASQNDDVRFNPLTGIRCFLTP